jgi:uncharacterized protein (DUF302 family)
VHVPSSESFDQTVLRLEDAIRRAGLEIFATIDHAAAASAYGIQMPPATVLLYGHPKGGTPIMVAAPDLALELPLRVLVREGSAGDVLVTWRAMGPVLRAQGVPVAFLEPIERSQRLIQEALR